MSITHYVSSKLRHRDLWIEHGVRTNSSWLNSPKIENPVELGEMWETYFDEIRECDVLALYIEPGDVPKGALVELGAALGVGQPVDIVWAGDVVDLEKIVGTVIYHPNVTVIGSIKELRN